MNKQNKKYTQKKKSDKKNIDDENLPPLTKRISGILEDKIPKDVDAMDIYHEALKEKYLS